MLSYSDTLITLYIEIQCKSNHGGTKNKLPTNCELGAYGFFLYAPHVDLHPEQIILSFMWGKGSIICRILFKDAMAYNITSQLLYKKKYIYIYIIWP